MSDITKKITYGELENKEYQALFKFTNGETVLGVINYDNGDVYMGEIKPDEKCDGKRDRRRHGYGKVFPKRGKVVDGEWHLGQVIGKSVTFDKKGKRTVEVRGSDPSFRSILYSYYLTDDNKYGGDNYNGLYKDKFWEGDFEDVLRRGDLREQLFGGKAGVGTPSPAAPDKKSALSKEPTPKAKAKTPEKQPVKTKKNGQFRCELDNGDVYEGGYKDDKRHGKGKYISRKGWTYEGDFMFDEMTGNGKVVFANGQTYEGGWLFGKRHGHGEEKYANGNRYVGEYNQDQFHGQGTYYYADGDIYEGSYESGIRSGHGIYKSLSRGKDSYNCTEGTWVDGERVGWHDFFTLSVATGDVHLVGDRFYIKGERYQPTEYPNLLKETVLDIAKNKGTIFNKWRSIDKSKFNDAAAFGVDDTQVDPYSMIMKYTTELATVYTKTSDEGTPDYERLNLIIVSQAGKEKYQFDIQESHEFLDYTVRPERKLQKIKMYFHWNGRFVKREYFVDPEGNLCGVNCLFEKEDWPGATLMDCLSIPDSQWKYIEMD